MIVPTLVMSHENFIEFIYNHTTSQYHQIYRLYDGKKIAHAHPHVWSLLHQTKSTNIGCRSNPTFITRPIVYFDGQPKEVCVPST